MDYDNDNSALVHSEEVSNINSVIVCGLDFGNVGAVSLNMEYQKSKDKCCTSLWKNELRGTGANIPCIKFDSSSKIVFVAIKGRVYAFNPITGEMLWKIHPSSQKGFVNAITSHWSDLIISQHHLYCTQSGRLMKISLEGYLEWDTDLHLGSKHAVCTVASSKHQDIVFVGVKRTVICVNRTSGDIVWKIKLPNQHWGGITMATNSSKFLCAATDGVVYSLKYENGDIVPVALVCDPSDDSVFYATCGIQLIAFKMEEGSLLQMWTTKIKKVSNYCLPLLIDADETKTKGILVSSCSHIRCFHPSTGELVWNTSLKNSFITRGFTSMVHLNDTTLVCATPNHLVGVSKSTGELEWEDKMKGWNYPMAMFLATARQSMDFSAAPIMHAKYHSNMDSASSY